MGGWASGRSRRALLLVSFAVVASCAAGGGGPTTAGTAASAAPIAPSPSASPSSSPAASASSPRPQASPPLASAPAAPPSVGHAPAGPAPSGATPGKHACGDGTCDKGETCCGLDDDRRWCIPGVKSDPEEFDGPCSKLAAPLADVGNCDDSGDCARGMACCERKGNRPTVECTKAGTGREPVCAEGERCRVDRDCKTPSARCVGSVCVPRRPLDSRGIDCAGKRCSPGQVCCVGEEGARCSAADRCEELQAMVCTRGTDCAPGEMCVQIAGPGARCAYYGGVAYQALCETNAECAPVAREFKPMNVIGAKCTGTSSVPWRKACETISAPSP